MYNLHHSPSGYGTTFHFPLTHMICPLLLIISPDLDRTLETKELFPTLTSLLGKLHVHFPKLWSVKVSPLVLKASIPLKRRSILVFSGSPDTLSPPYFISRTQIGPLYERDP